MSRDPNAPITIERANGFAQARSGGELSIVSEDGHIHLCRKGNVIVRELSPEQDMTEHGIVRALAHWDQRSPQRA